MTINDVYGNGEISVRSYKTCIDNQINTVNALKEHYYLHKSFSHLKNCGRKTNLELISICLKYEDLDKALVELDAMANKNITNILSSLSEQKQRIINKFIEVKFSKLTARTSNVLKNFLLHDLKITNLKQILFANYYVNLCQIKGAGPKSQQEIDCFITEVKIFIISCSNINNNCEVEALLENETMTDIVYTIDKLNENQSAVINSLITTLNERLSVRSYKVLVHFLNAEPNLNFLKQKIFSIAKFDPISFERIGKTSALELKTYLHEIESFINNIANITNSDELDLINVDVQFRSKYNSINTEYFLNRTNFVFYLIAAILKNQDVFDKNELLVLKNTINIYNNSVLSNLLSVAKRINLGKERVRQLRSSVLDKIKLELQLFKNIDSIVFLDYGIDTNKKFIIITETNVSTINNREKTAFSKQFIVFICSIILEGKFSLVGNLKDVLHFRDNKVEYRHTWKNIYLVRNEIKKSFDFLKFVDFFKDEDILTHKSVINGLPISFLNKFKIDDRFSDLEVVKTICETILVEEFLLKA